jgi:hypothetical protein
MPKYEIKNLKTGPSREWGPKGAFTCTLYHDGRRVCRVFEAGDGGCTTYEWLDWKDGAELTPEERMFAEFADTLTTMGFDNTEMTHNPDSYISQLVDEFEDNKEYRRLCRKETFFRLKGDEKEMWRRMKISFSDSRVKPTLVERFGDQIEEILNERFV